MKTCSTSIVYRLVAVVLLAALFLMPTSTALAANPAPVQTYYVTLPEYDGLVALDTINGRAGRPVYTYFSISVATAGSYVYYDQWENGYVGDIANPTAAEIYDATTNPGGVQIWGNGVCADGFPPNKSGTSYTLAQCTAAPGTVDHFAAGDVVIPSNAVDMDFTPNANYNYDTFSNNSYTNNNGTQNFGSGWTEYNTGDTSATSGVIYVSGGKLVFNQTQSDTARDWIARRSSAPTGYVCAEMSFDLSTNGQVEFDGTDRLGIIGQDSSGTPGWAAGNLMGVDGVDPTGHYVLDLPHYTNYAEFGFVSYDSLETGEQWLMDNVRVEWGPCWRDQSEFYYDGRDKIGASGSIAMARATWANGSSTLNAFAHEMYPTAEWGTEYQSPVGCDTSLGGGTSMFEYSALSIMALTEGTQVQISYDANDTFEQTVTLDEGQATLAGYYNFATGCDYVRQGARVLADKPIQVVLITGDIASNYGSRDMTLLPVSKFGTTAWSPVGCGVGDQSTTWTNYPAQVGSTRLFLYNPRGNATTYVCCERYNSTTALSAGSVAPRSTGFVDTDLYWGARCYTSSTACTSPTPNNLPLFGIGAYDSYQSTTYVGSAGDWSYTMYPSTFLSTDVLVGMGLGRDPTAAASNTENGSPLWVTTACDAGSTWVYADWNNDGTPDAIDFNGDGDTGDDNVDGYTWLDESTSTSGTAIPRLASVRFYDPTTMDSPYDQTAARIWSRTASGVGYGGTAGCNISVAWGQDALHSSPGSPGLDVGTTVTPLRLIEVSKGLTLKTDVDDDEQLSPGDVVTYLVTLKNIGNSDISSINLYDLLNTTYMTYNVGTTAYSLDNGATWIPVSDDTVPPAITPFPLDESGKDLPNRGAGAIGLLQFDVTLTNTGAYYDRINNCATLISSAGERTPCTTNYVASADWGDLPDTYNTSLSNNGPRHSPSASGLRLGSHFDKELQGAPVAAGTDATGDDIYQTTLPKGDDEDGVVLTQLNNGGAAGGTVRVTVTDSTCTTNCACLNAYMDFTNDASGGAGPAYADGNFRWTSNPATYDSYGGYSEHIISNYLLNASPTGLATSVSFDVPTNLNPAGGTNYYYFRFRLTPSVGGACTTDPTPVGLATGGEVEDYRWGVSPLAVDLASFTAEAAADGVTLAWETVSETDNAGFNIYRANAAAGPWTQLNAALIPAATPGSSEGHTYSYADTAAAAGATTWYMLEDVDLNGTAAQHEPVSITLAGPNAVSLTTFSAAGAALPALGGLAGLALAALAGVGLRKRR